MYSNIVIFLVKWLINKGEWIDDLQFYILFKNISVIPEPLEADNERLWCNGTLFMVHMISASSRIDPQSVDQSGPEDIKLFSC